MHNYQVLAILRFATRGQWQAVFWDSWERVPGPGMNYSFVVFVSVKMCQDFEVVEVVWC